MTKTYESMIAKLDREAPYFWVECGGSLYKLINQVTYKTAWKMVTLYEAKQLTRKLTNDGFIIKEIK